MTERDDDEDLYDDLYEDDPCDHEDRDVDILTGRASCWRCGEAWWLTTEQLEQELKVFAECAEQQSMDEFESDNAAWAASFIL